MSGIDATMEFSSDGGTTWTAYDNNLPDLATDITLDVRVMATGTTMASSSVSLVYAVPATPVVTLSFDGTDANKVMGSETTMEYSIDAGVSYSDVSEDDMTLDAGVLSSIDPTKDLLIRVKETGSEEASAIATIDIIAAPSVTFSFNGNDADKLMGALTTMSYSLDGGTTYNDVGSDDVLLSSSAIESMTASTDIHIKN